MTYKLSRHAKSQLSARGMMIHLDKLIESPQQIFIENDILIHQSIIDGYLYRILINQSSKVIVTGYRTSKISKYWKDES